MQHRHITGIALLLASGLARADASPTLHAKIESLLAAQPSVASSLPAHPMGDALLSACVALVMRENAVDELTAMRSLCTWFGDAPLGLLALETVVARLGPEDASDYCGQICTDSPNLRIAPLALEHQLRADPGALGTAQRWIEQGGDTRVGIYARLRRAELLEASVPCAAAADLLEAWAMAPPSRAEEMATRAREFLAAHGQTTEVGLLGKAGSPLPVPQGLLSRRAKALRDLSQSSSGSALWRAHQDAWDVGDESHPADLAAGLILQARAAKASSKGQLDALRAARIQGETGHEALLAALGQLAVDEQAYFILLFVDQSARDFEPNRARGLLSHIPADPLLRIEYQEAAAALRAGLAEEHNVAGKPI